MNTIFLQETVAASSTQLPNNPVTNDITLYAKSSNTGVVYIGNTSTVTSSTGFPLEKGTSIRLKIANTNQIFYIGTASDILSVAGS